MLYDECKQEISSILKQYLFEINDESTRNMIKEHIERAFQNQEVIFSCRASVNIVDEKLRTEVSITTIDDRVFNFDIIL